MTRGAVKTIRTAKGRSLQEDTMFNSNLKTFAIKLKLEISYFQPDLSISFTALGLSSPKLLTEV
jgi:hypothetical protein